MTDKENLVNTIMIECMQKFPNIDHNLLRNIILVKMNDYEISREEREIVVYEGNVNDNLLKSFLIAKKVNGLTDRTLRYYRYTLEFVFNKIKKPAHQITANDVRMYLAYREINDHVSATTRDNERRALSSLFDWMQDEQMIPVNPIKKITRIHGPKKKKSAFSEIDVEKIRSACSTKFEKALIEILLSTGCRLSEVIGIKISEIDDNKVIVHGKGQKDRTCYFNARAQLALTEYLNDRSDGNPYAFPSSRKGPNGEERHLGDHTVYQIVKKIGVRAGVPNCHPHRFRRTCATFALRRGMSVEQVSKMLGHEDLSTTQIYLDLNERDMELAHEKYVI